MTGAAPFSTMAMTQEPVAIIAVDPVNRTAQGLTRTRIVVNIRCDIPVGGVYVIPAKGDQWYVDRVDNAFWKLTTRIPFNDNNTLIAPVEGQMILGGTGPVELNGSQTNVHGILALGDTLLRSGDNGLESSGPALMTSGPPLMQSLDAGETWTPIGGGGGGTIEDITGLQEALDAKVNKPVPPITGDTKTKITYDSDGLVTAGADATIPDITGLTTALDSKANLVHTHSEDDVIGLVADLAGKAAVDHTHTIDGASLDPDLVDIGALTPADQDFIQRISGHWTNVPPSAVKGGLGISFPDILGILSGGQIPSLDASKIGSGTFLTSLIPSLDASKIGSGTFLAGLIPSLDASKIGSGTFLTSLIPNLSASKITSGVFGLPQIPTLDSLHIPTLDASKIGTGTFLTSLIPGLDAAQIVSGIFGTGQIPGLPASKITSGQFPQSMLNITSVAAGIISGTLGLGQIPNLPASQITSGTFGAGLIPGLDAGKIVSGTFLTSLIPALDASQITSGIFGIGLIPNLDASQITSGIFGAGLIPSLDAGKITSGVLNLLRIPSLDTTRIPSLDASKITTGTLLQSLIPLLSTSQIPSLDASQITSGIFGTGLIPNLDAGKITTGILNLLRIPGLPAGQITSGVFGTGLIPSLDAGKITSGILALAQIPGLDLTRIPNLPASQITSGQFGAGLIPVLDATKITSGIFNLAQIPGLDLTRIPSLPASQITSGIFGTGLIPNLDANKITTGIIDLLRLPGMPTSQITSGTFPQNMITNLPTDLSSIFTTITSPISSTLLQNVPVSSIGQFNPELLTNPNYDTLGSVAGGSTGWTWDPAVSHTAGSTGSARVTGNGSTQQLLSDPPIPVSPNQVLSISHWLQWSGVTASAGVAFRLSVGAYLGAGISNTVDIQVINTPGASSGWTQLSGTYTVPASGVDNIRLQLTVTSLVSAGTIWWDDGSVKKTQLLSENWTSGLPGDLANLLTGINARALITDLTGLQSTLGLGDPSLTAITSRLAGLGAGGGFNAASLTNIANIPQLLAASVAGIGGIGNIGASVQQTWDTVAGVSAGTGNLAGITSRLTNLNSSGLFNAAQLFNINSIPLLPAGSVPLLDASKIVSGILPLAQIPVSQLDRTTLTDIGATLDQITNAWVGQVFNPFTGTDPGQARQSMDSFYSDFLALTQKVQDMRSQQTATDVSGTTVTVNFGDMPDGPLPSSFTATYTGSGTSSIGITSGAAGWRTQVNNGNRTGIIVYNIAPTNTDFQIVRGTLSGAPPSDNGGSKPMIAAIGRVDNPANPRNYVWARGYNNGFLTYQGDVGCTINGVDTVWFSGIPLTWSMDINVIFGVGGNPRRYQVFSGTTLVKDFLEPGTASRLGAGFRYWGCKTDLKTDSGKVIAPPAVVGTSVSDNQPPAVTGSTFRAYRASTGGVTFSGTGVVPTSPPYFDTPQYRSADMLWDGANLTIGVEGTYLVNIRYKTPNIPGGAKADVALALNGGLARRMGGDFADSSFGANSATAMSGIALVYCHVNDILTPGYIVTSNVSATGETTGTESYIEVALVNRSMA